MKNKKEFLCYCVNGGLTTLVNYAIYFLLLKTQVHFLTANTLAWAGAVLFAYFMNRRWVFHSKSRIFQEFFSFVYMRFLTLLVENLLLWLFIELWRISSLPSKILVSVVTVIANYALCKHKIFHKSPARTD